MPQTRWSAEAWAQVRVEFRKVLALRSQIRRGSNEYFGRSDLDCGVEGRPRLMTCACGAVLVRVATFR